MSKIIVLGAGMVGRAMAIDLAKKHEVTSADISETALQSLSDHKIKTFKADLSVANKIKELVKDFDLVVGSVPGFLGFNMMRAVIEAKKNIVDISFYPEDPFELDELAKKNNVIAIMDVGVAPGMSNLLLGYHNKRMKVQEFECLVGGLPVVRTWPFEYKAPFSPIDVIEEYIRPARFIKDGKLVVKPALSDPELMDFEGVGTLEVFNSDGLRSLVKTIDAPNMIERTMRYPGHIELMRVLRETGFFEKEEIDVKGKKIRPIDLTSKLLFEKWKLGECEDELTVMRITVKGEGKTIVYHLLDRYDRATNTSSMARTTGYTCTAAAKLVLNGMYKRVGISPPEFIGEDEACVNFILRYLEARGVVYRKETI